jgi:hypothetical protein
MICAILAVGTHESGQGRKAFATSLEKAPKLSPADAASRLPVMLVLFATKARFDVEHQTPEASRTGVHS